MRYTLLILIIFLSACNNESKNESAGSDTSSTTITQTSVPLEINAKTILRKDVPAEIKPKGNIHETWTWTDKLGENFLMTVVVPPYRDKEKNEYDEEGETSEIHAYHYIREGSNYRLLWKLDDIEKACPFDITVDYINDGTIISDLDGDGIAESTIQYRMACRSDVSPSVMKVVMHEDTAQYILKGLMWLQASPDQKFDITEANVNAEKMPKKDDEYESFLVSIGRYENERGFNSAPPAFLDHAKKRWLKFVKETFD